MEIEAEHGTIKIKMALTVNEAKFLETDLGNMEEEDEIAMSVKMVGVWPNSYAQLLGKCLGYRNPRVEEEGLQVSVSQKRNLIVMMLSKKGNK